MKKIFLLITSVFVLFVTKSFAQSSHIYGTIADHLDYKYAYLYDQASKTFETATITNHKFSFKVDKPDQFKIVSLSFNGALMKNHQEMIESPDFAPPYRPRMIALEDTVKISLLDEEGKQILVEGNRYNQDINDMYLAIKSKQYKPFFELHQDSPVSLIFLKTLTNMAAGNWPFFTKQDCKSYYDKLSDQLKNSDQGREIFAIMSKWPS